MTQRKNPYIPGTLDGCQCSCHYTEIDGVITVVSPYGGVGDDHCPMCEDAAKKKDSVLAISSRHESWPPKTETPIKVVRHNNREGRVLELPEKQLTTLLGEAERRGAEKLGDRLRRKRKPTHGNCCTCQECGQPHDECACEINKLVDEELNRLGDT